MNTSLLINFTFIVFAVNLLSACSSVPKEGENFKTDVVATGNQFILPIEVANVIKNINLKKVNKQSKESTENTSTNDQDNSTSNTDLNKTNSNLTTNENINQDSTAQVKINTRNNEPNKISRKIANTNENKNEYKVKKGDTLMKIAFEKYGDIFKWKELYELNKNKINNLSQLKAGTILNLNGEDFILIEKNGEPYLIRRRDTLLRISNKVYGTPVHWKSIWQNNRQLIHDPNKIYAGFTIYYIPKSELNVLKQQLSKSIDSTIHMKNPRNNMLESKAEERLPANTK